MNSMDVVIFGIKLKLRPIAFTIPIGGGWHVYWYGIIIALGFLLAVIYAVKNAARFNINTDRMLDVTLITTPLAILCARSYYLIFDGEPLGGISEFFGFGNSQGFSGLAIYGGVIGAFVIGPIACKLRKVSIRNMVDLASIGFIIGQCVGRWGNFVNQEAYGTFTHSSWWGMQSARTISEMGEGLVHPCFLYESLWCLAGFFILHRFSKKRKFAGQIFLMYCAWYGFGRTFIELLRTDSLMIGNIRVSCLLSLLICITAIILLYVFGRNQKEHAADGSYNEIFETEEPEEAEAEKAEITESESADDNAEGEEAPQSETAQPQPENAQPENENDKENKDD